MKYHAFISYSHADKTWGDWLHKALETYKVPKPLVGKTTTRTALDAPADGPPTFETVPARAYPIFRDREELPTATDLGSILHAALRESRYLIVICSPRSAQSQWVNEEILYYKRLGRENRILALIVAGEPNAADGKPGFTIADECFPEALKFKLGPDGELSSTRTEPIAADARDGKDGKQNALLKLLAGVLGVNFDDLRQRDAEYQRRRLRRAQFAASAFAGLALAAGLAGWLAWRGQKNSAQREINELLSQADADPVLAAGRRILAEATDQEKAVTALHAKAATTLHEGDAIEASLAPAVEERCDSLRRLQADLQRGDATLADFTPRLTAWRETADATFPGLLAELETAEKKSDVVQNLSSHVLQSLTLDQAADPALARLADSLRDAADNLDPLLARATELKAAARVGTTRATALEARRLASERLAARSAFTLGELQATALGWADAVARKQARWQERKETWHDEALRLADSLALLRSTTAEWHAAEARWREYIEGFGERRALRPWIEHAARLAIITLGGVGMNAGVAREGFDGVGSVSDGGGMIDFASNRIDPLPSDPAHLALWLTLRKLRGECRTLATLFEETHYTLGSRLDELAFMESEGRDINAQIRDLERQVKQEADAHQRFKTEIYTPRINAWNTPISDLARLFDQAAHLTRVTDASALRLATHTQEILVLARVLPPAHTRPDAKPSFSPITAAPVPIPASAPDFADAAPDDTPPFSDPPPQIARLEASPIFSLQIRDIEDSSLAPPPTPTPEKPTDVRAVYLGSVGERLASETLVHTAPSATAAGEPRIEETVVETRPWDLRLDFEVVTEFPDSLHGSLSVRDSLGKHHFAILSLAISNAEGAALPVRLEDAESRLLFLFAQSGEHIATARGVTEWGSRFEISTRVAVDLPPTKKAAPAP